MKAMTTRALAAVAILALAGPLVAADGPPPPRQERVTFAKGASSATVKGTLKGGADVDYLVRAAAGQTLQVKLQGTNSQNDFNVLPPGSASAAMYVSSMTGERSWSGMLPADGDYAIRVYLMRPAARRNEASKYTLTVGVTGNPLAPLSAARDAKVAGTAYHATAKLPCTLPYQPDVKSCDAGVVRRGHDGTATFEAIGAMGVQRRILFVQGKPVAADTMDPVTATRQGDVTIVKVRDAERYDIPDAFLNGG
ncbi:MAG: hypothetical protein IPG28_20020 [Betaproteobacteria bacterium]|nr:hypothetical protein [Betaproteobacteria bacterium]